MLSQRRYPVASLYRKKLNAGNLPIAVLACAKACLIKRLRRTAEIAKIHTAGGLVGRMHGELRKTDVGAADGDLFAGEVAQRGAAGDIAAVDVLLYRDIGAFANMLKDGLRYRVGGVALVGVVFDKNTAV